MRPKEGQRDYGVVERIKSTKQVEVRKEKDQNTSDKTGKIVSAVKQTNKLLDIPLNIDQKKKLNVHRSKKRLVDSKNKLSSVTFICSGRSEVLLSSFKGIQPIKTGSL